MPQQKTELVLVETISMFRMRYVVEVPIGKTDYATDTVIMGKDTNDKEIVEFSQKHLDEVINSTRVLSKEEYLNIFNEDNDYLQTWTEGQKLNMINKGYYDVE